MTSYFETTKQRVIEDLRQLIVEIENKKEIEFLRLLNDHKDEEDPASVVCFMMFYISETRVNQHLKNL